jgi:anaerobic selenocysteine-containing dehydrogenase
MYEISEDGTFNQNLSTGGLNSMTNSWWIKTSSVAANNDVMYGSTEVAGTVGWADGDTVKITRSSGTFTVYRNGSSLHEWSQTSSNEVRIVVAQGDVNVTLDQFCWVDAGTLGNNFLAATRRQTSSPRCRLCGLTLPCLTAT